MFADPCLPAPLVSILPLCVSCSDPDCRRSVTSRTDHERHPGKRSFRAGETSAHPRRTLRLAPDACPKYFHAFICCGSCCKAGANQGLRRIGKPGQLTAPLFPGTVRFTLRAREVGTHEAQRLRGLPRRRAHAGTRAIARQPRLDLPGVLMESRKTGIPNRDQFRTGVNPEPGSESAHPVVYTTHRRRGRARHPDGRCANGLAHDHSDQRAADLNPWLHEFHWYRLPTSVDYQSSITRILVAVNDVSGLHS